MLTFFPMARKIISILLIGIFLTGCARNMAEQLVSGEEGVRQAALKKLEDADDATRKEILPFLVERLSSENGNVRRRAVQALTRLGADAVNPLVRALTGADRKARAAAAETLGHLGGAAKSAAGPLVEAERDDDAEVRAWAGISLERIKASMSSTELQLFKLLYGKKEVVSPSAAAAAVFPPEDSRSLLQGLRNADARGRTEAVFALVEKGSLIVPSLLTALTDTDEGVRDGAAEALRLLTRDQADVDQALVSFLKDGDAASRAAYAQAFKGIDRASAASVPALAALTTNESLCVRLEAVRALGALGPGAKAAVPALQAAGNDAHPAVRQASLRALRRVLRPVPDAAQKALAKKLGALWSEMTVLLARREIETALGSFADARRDAYRSAFLALGDALPVMAKSLDVPLSFRDAFGDRVVTLEGNAFIEGVQQTLEVQFVKDDKGEWKIRNF